MWQPEENESQKRIAFYKCSIADSESSGKAIRYRLSLLHNIDDDDIKNFLSTTSMVRRKYREQVPVNQGSLDDWSLIDPLSIHIIGSLPSQSVHVFCCKTLSEEYHS